MSGVREATPNSAEPVRRRRMMNADVVMLTDRRQYTEDFKRDVVRLVCEVGRPIAQVARDLGITRKAIYHWRAVLKAVDVESPQLVAHDELARLQQENQRLRLERDCFRRAAALFARELP